MAKVTGGLLSIDAKGTFAGTIVFANFGALRTVRKKRVSIAPFDPKTPTQLFNRDFFSSVVAIWKNLSMEEKSTLDSVLDIMPMSGFNYYMKEYRKRPPTDIGNTRLGFSQLGDLTF